MRIAIMTFAVAMAAAPLGTGAQMRPDQPAVLSPAPRPAPVAATPWAALRERMGTRNRVMLFWEAELDGQLTTHYRDVETTERRVHGNAAQVAGVAGDHGGAVGVAIAGGESHLHERSERFTEGDAPERVELSGESRSMQSEFMAQLRQGGVRFIDRTLATRLTGMSVEGERPNVHAIETRALVGLADYLMEVTSRADAGSPSGRRYHVALRDVASGETLVDFDTAATVEAGGPSAWVAGPGGFERGAPKPATDADIAHVLASETGRQMAGAVVRR